MALDEEDVGELVAAFARAVIDPTEWMPALSKMSHAMGSASSSLELADLNTGLASINCTYPLDGDIVEIYEERIYHINPRVHRARKIPVGVIVDDRSLLIDGDPNIDEFMDWLDKTPNRFVEGAKLFQGGGHEIYFGSYFSKAHGPPQSWHSEVHRLIVPHLINIISVGRILSANKLNNELLKLDAFEADRPFALLDKKGRLIECSVGFETILKSRQVLGLRNRNLVAMHPKHRPLVDRFIEAALGARRMLEPPMPVRLATPDSPRGLILRSVPLTLNNDIFDIFRPAALITLADLDRPSRVKRAELVALFGLTKREADVAALVSEGCTPESVAHELAISEYTVRQHLKVVFGKIGVRRQAELVAIVARLA